MIAWPRRVSKESSVIIRSSKYKLQFYVMVAIRINFMWRFNISTELISLSRRNTDIVREDWNACIGDDAFTNSIIGKYGIGIQCANGERLRFAEQHELFVANTCFRHWSFSHMEFSDNKYSNQIDYLLVGHSWMSFLFDSRFIGAETGNCHGSDPVIVRAKIRIKLKS